MLGFAGATDIADGIIVALLIWFGFILLPNVPLLLIKKDPSVAFGIEQGAHAVGVIAMGIILVLWT